MTAFRLIPLSIHAALRSATGLLTMIAPFAFGLGAAATVVFMVVGALATGLALHSLADERGITPLPVSTLHTLDYAMVLTALGAALGLGLGGDLRGCAVLGAIGLVQLAGNLVTRYSLTA